MLLELSKATSDRWNLANLLSEFGICKTSNYYDFLRYSESVGKKTYLYYLDPSRTRPEECFGTCSFILEPKFFHELKFVAHVEDVVVHKEHRGRGLGKIMIKELIEKIKSFSLDKKKIYKIILDCNDKNVHYYESCGFRKVENCMRIDL